MPPTTSTGASPGICTADAPRALSGELPVLSLPVAEAPLLPYMVLRLPPTMTEPSPRLLILSRPTEGMVRIFLEGDSSPLAPSPPPLPRRPPPTVTSTTGGGGGMAAASAEDEVVEEDAEEAVEEASDDGTVLGGTGTRRASSNLTRHARER